MVVVAAVVVHFFTVSCHLLKCVRACVCVCALSRASDRIIPCAINCRIVKRNWRCCCWISFCETHTRARVQILMIVTEGVKNMRECVYVEGYANKLGFFVCTRVKKVNGFYRDFCCLHNKQQFVTFFFVI